MWTSDDLAQLYEALKPWIPFIAMVANGLFTAIVWIFNSRRSARKDALDAANQQIASQAKSLAEQSEMYDNLLERFEQDHREWMEERDRLRLMVNQLEIDVQRLISKYGVALLHIQTLRGLMEDCKIPIPPLPAELSEA